MHDAWPFVVIRCLVLSNSERAFAISPLLNIKHLNISTSQNAATGSVWNLWDDSYSNYCNIISGSKRALHLAGSWTSSRRGYRWSCMRLSWCPSDLPFEKKILGFLALVWLQLLENSIGNICGRLDAWTRTCNNHQTSFLVLIIIVSATLDLLDYRFSSSCKVHLYWSDLVTTIFFNKVAFFWTRDTLGLLGCQPYI